MARSHASPSHSPREKHAERPEKTSDSSRKSHHVRRKSGGPRDEKKKPALTRKTTPQLVKTSSGRRDRDRDRDDDTGRDRDGGESFPQFCMTCEKQFLPVNSTILYCSESCRLHDQAPASTRPQSFSALPSISPPASPYYQHHHFPSDGPDIIPRFSPTQPRPRSYYHHNSADNTSYTAPSSYHPSSTSHFPPSAARTSASSRSSTALASLRDIAAALPRSPSHHPSPPRSPTTAAAGVWSFIPFSQSKTATPTPSATPGNSYGSPGMPHSQSYNGAGEYASAATAGDDPFAARRNSTYSVTYASGVGVGMDRPLPPRSGPGGYGNRGRNIDLVTPFGVGY